VYNKETSSILEKELHFIIIGATDATDATVATEEKG
jgi:hypothetical protein